MDNYVAVVFDTDQKAFDALHQLWNLNDRGDITVHGAAVVHRDKYGFMDVATKDTQPGLRTAVGIALGALLGALAGPIGSAAGATVAAGTAAGVGAAAGGFVGGTADVLKAGEHEEFASETSFIMAPGQSAVIAEVSEDWTTPIDTSMARMGGKIFRRSKDAVRESPMWGDYGLYPYDYNPAFRN